MSKVSEVIFIDESGDDSLSRASINHCKYFVLGFVYCRSPFKLKKEMRRLLRKLKKKKYPKKINELKFSLPIEDLYKKHEYTKAQVTKYLSYSNENRMKMIHCINKNCDGVFGAIVDKSQVKRTIFNKGEDLGNYIFAHSLSKYILPQLKCRHPPTVYYDKGRLSAYKSSTFKLYLHDTDQYIHQMGLNNGELLGPAQEISSLSEPCIWASDIVAGVYRYNYVYQDSKFREMLTKRIPPGHHYFFIG